MQFTLNFASNNKFIAHQLDKNTLTNLEQEYDSLQQNHIKKERPKRFPFNPNFISSYKGYELGMSLKEMNFCITLEQVKTGLIQLKIFSGLQEFQILCLRLFHPILSFQNG